MKKKIKLTLCMCAVALILGVGAINGGISLLVDPPYGLINLK